MSGNQSELRMPDINQISLAGNLTRDPELSYIQSGTALCKLGMAVNKKYTTKSGEKREDTLFINVTVWGKSAEYVGEHMKKGYPVLVNGRLQMDEWQDNDGAKRTSWSVNADRVQQLTWDNSRGNGGDGNDPGGCGGAPKPRVIEEPLPEDDIPF